MLRFPAEITWLMLDGKLEGRVVPAMLDCMRERSPRPNSPDFELKWTIAVDQLEIRPVTSDQARSARAGGQCNQHIEVQITQLFCSESPGSANFAQQLS